MIGSKTTTLPHATGVTIDQLDREFVRHSRGLHFAPVVEKAFLDSYLADRAPMVPLWAALGTVLYCLSALGDLTMLPANANLLLFFRFGIFLPYALAVVVIMHFWPSARNYELLALGVGILGALLPMGVLAVTPSPYAFVYQTGTISTLLFFVVVLRPRFAIALVGVALILAIQFTTTYLNGGFDTVTYSGIVTTYVTFGAFLLLVAFSFESTERRTFLHRLRNELLTDRLRYQSEHDDLSTLRNRRSLTALLDRLWQTPDGRAVSAIMLDIDHFKLYNDVHGHIAGDNCIRTVSRIVREAIGTRGTAFRYGGEELLIVLPDADLDAVLSLAETIRRDIEAAALPHHGLAQESQAIVTASLGVASLSTAQGLPGQLLAEADAALYEAKHLGRNRVHPHPADTRTDKPDPLRAIG